MRAVAFGIALFILQFAGSGPASAHPLAPSLLEIREQAAGHVLVTWKQPLQSLAAAPLPVLPAACRALGAPVVTSDEFAHTVDMEIACDHNLVGSRFGVSGLAGSRANVVLRVVLMDGRVIHHILRPGDDQFVVPARPRPIDITASYLKLGVTHIGSGIDHLLFLLGLVGLASSWRVLVGMVTAFTAGHALSLSAAALEQATLPTMLIESLIAASILILALELTRRPGPRPSLLRRRPWSLTFCFGLLHGLGFASALAEAGLPAGETVLALLGFNLGIEAGQIVFVAAVAVLLRILRGNTEQWHFQPRAMAYGIGSFAAYLLLERLHAVLP
jgi:hypothetical protein